MWGIGLEWSGRGVLSVVVNISSLRWPCLSVAPPVSGPLPHACSVCLCQPHALLFATISLVMGSMPHMAAVTVKCWFELPVGVPAIAKALVPYIRLISAWKVHKACWYVLGTLITSAMSLLACHLCWWTLHTTTFGKHFLNKILNFTNYVGGL